METTSIVGRVVRVVAAPANLVALFVPPLYEMTGIGSYVEHFALVAMTSMMVWITASEMSVERARRRSSEPGRCETS